MNPLTHEWIEKAEGDYRTAQREFSTDESPNYDAVSFHAQQCAEKYLKGRLTEAGVAFPRTHSLTALLHLLVPLGPEWANLKPDAAQLTAYAVEFRYPGKAADKPLAKDAFGYCRHIRDHVRIDLGLDKTPTPLSSSPGRKKPRSTKRRVKESFAGWTPSPGRITRPWVMSWGTIRLMVSTGMAKPMPALAPDGL